MIATLSSETDGGGSARPATSTEVCAYISDLLSQCAEMARAAGERRLEAGLRTLALEAAAAAGDTPLA